MVAGTLLNYIRKHPVTEDTFQSWRHRGMSEEAVIAWKRYLKVRSRRIALGDNPNNAEGEYRATLNEEMKLLDMATALLPPNKTRSPEIEAAVDEIFQSPEAVRNFFQSFHDPEMAPKKYRLAARAHERAVQEGKVLVMSAR